MSEEKLSEAFRTLIPLPPRRYRQCRVMLARQAALKIAGPDHQAYFTQWQAKVIAEAGERIATSTRYLYRYRLNSPARKWLHKG
jgi:hypothetical protein